MAIAVLAGLVLLGASSARAEAPAPPSAAAQQITEARLALVREQLPLALALPANLPQQPAPDSECPQPYKAYRDALDAFAATVVSPMHSRNDPVEAKKEFDRAYLCAARLARQAAPESFQAIMAGKLEIMQAQLSRLGPAERRQLVQQLAAQRSLEGERISRQRADKSVKSAMDIVNRLQDSRLSSQDLSDLGGAVKPGAGARRFAEGWLNDPLYASEFRPPLPAHYRNLDEKAVPAVPTAAAPVQTSVLASFIAQVASIPRRYAQKAEDYVQRVSNAIINSSAARDIDARLSAAIVWAESNFNSAAKSWAECVGLGQLSKGVARAYGMRDGERTDIDKNVRGTTGYLNEQIQTFATADDKDRLKALFEEGSASVQKAVAGGQTKQQAVDDAFKRIWPEIPTGMKNAVAAYNSGPYALLDSRTNKVKRNWNQLVRPGACEGRRPAHDNSYCQTVAYVPKVLKRYFTVVVETSYAPLDQQPQLFTSAAHYQSAPQSGL